MLVKVILHFELGICPSIGVLHYKIEINKIGTNFQGLNKSKITVPIMTHQVGRNENKKSIYHGSPCTRDFNAILSFKSQNLIFQII